MKELWNRIEAWLRANAPAAYNGLQPGASAEAIREAESRLQASLPEDVRACFAAHNGSGYANVFPRFYLLSLKELVQESERLRAMLEQGAFGNNEVPAYARRKRIKPNHWNVGWVPFAHDTGGNYLCVDLDPGAGGTVEQIIEWDHEEGATQVLAASLSTYLAAFAADLEAGRLRTNPDGELEFV